MSPQHCKFKVSAQFWVYYDKQLTMQTPQLQQHTLFLLEFIEHKHLKILTLLSFNLLKQLMELFNHMEHLIQQKDHSMVLVFMIQIMYSKTLLQKSIQIMKEVLLSHMMVVESIIMDQQENQYLLTLKQEQLLMDI